MKDEIRRMITDLHPALKSCGKQCAIGGAVAMALHGVARYTNDLDIFASDEIRLALLRAVRARGYRIDSVVGPFIYTARPPWRTSNEGVRVDLFFPAADPELSGVVSAEVMTPYKGVDVRVFNPLILTLTRVYSNEPRHFADLALMLERGVVPIDEVRDVLREYDLAGLRSFDKKLEQIAERITAPKRPKPGVFSRGSKKRRQ